MVGPTRRQSKHSLASPPPPSRHARGDMRDGRGAGWGPPMGAARFGAWGRAVSPLLSPGSRRGMGEASEMDSGIVLHSGPDSPVSPPKERVLVGQRQQQALEAQLDGCIQELRQLCLREAELTGTLPCEYPLKAGEKPPKVRRRIGAAFKLDEIAVLRGVVRQSLGPSCVPSISTLPMSPPSRSTAMYPLHAVPLCVPSIPAPHISPPYQPSTCSLHPNSPFVSPQSQPSISPAEDTRPPGPATPQRSPSPKDPTKEEEGESGPVVPAPIPWQETSLDRPYERTKNPSIDPEDGETQSSQWDPSYRFVPIRTVVLCRQAGFSAPSTPEPSGRQGQTQSLRVDPCCQPAEPRGRSATPRRRPTYYTVTVPTSCPLSPGPACRSGSDDSISDLSSISHATSPGSSSPDVSFAVPLPLAEPGYYPRGALQLLPPAGPLTFLYEQDLAPLRYQRLVPSRSRIVRTPSLKDYAPAGARGLSKAAVTEELKSWHQRARLRSARPHSLDRQGAFQRPHEFGSQSSPWGRTRVFVPQGPPVQVLRRSAAGVPVQVYMPENGEIVTQV
uniref:Innate immunity activator n=1 Tax=Junco hyemalis TaxID=40217 RepID=A0A8C5NPQ6_JUNHY